jgi:CelD/BcsL family acetyltransferase involved in cellulose biosynthesis
MDAVGVGLSLDADHPTSSGKAVLASAGLIARCHVIRHDTDLAPLLAGLHGNPFQSLPVLSSWFASFAGRGEARECFLVTLQLPNGTPVFGLPIIRRKANGLTRIELPFSGVVDFTTPFLSASPHMMPEPEALLSLLRSALPKADIAVFRRMTDGTPCCRNPLFHHRAAQHSRFDTWRVGPLEPREARHAQLSKATRKKLRRNRDKFLELPGARFVVPRTREEALPLLEKLETLQSQRIRRKGLPYALDCPRVTGFYRRMLVEGIERGNVLITGMMVEDAIVGVGYTLLSGNEAVYVRVASDFGPYSTLTPGLLISDAAMDEVYARGIRYFDFGMGDYRFKREMGGKANPLRDLIMPLSIAGMAAALAMRLYQRATLNPLLRGLLGRKALPTSGT